MLKYNLQFFGGRGGRLTTTTNTGNSRIPTELSTGAREQVLTERMKTAREKLSSLKAGKANQNINVTNPETGKSYNIVVEKVNQRDYWGRRTGGAATYTVRVTDRDTDERVWYNYGRDWKRTKDDIYRVTGISRR